MESFDKLPGSFDAWLRCLGLKQFGVVGFSWEVNFLKSNCVDKGELRDRVVSVLSVVDFFSAW